MKYQISNRYLSEYSVDIDLKKLKNSKIYLTCYDENEPIGISLCADKDDRFYDAMKEMRAIGNNLNQIARKANLLNFIDCALYKNEAENWNRFMINIKKEYLLSEEKNLL